MTIILFLFELLVYFIILRPHIHVLSDQHTILSDIPITDIIYRVSGDEDVYFSQVG